MAHRGRLLQNITLWEFRGTSVIDMEYCLLQLAWLKHGSLYRQLWGLCRDFHAPGAGLPAYPRVPRSRLTYRGFYCSLRSQ